MKEGNLHEQEQGWYDCGGGGGEAGHGGQRQW